MAKHTHPPPGGKEAELAAIKEMNSSLYPTLLLREGAAPHTQCFSFWRDVDPYKPSNRDRGSMQTSPTHTQLHSLGWGHSPPHTHIPHSTGAALRRAPPPKKHHHKHRKGGEGGGKGGGSCSSSHTAPQRLFLSHRSRCACVCVEEGGVTHSEGSTVTNRPPRATENPTAPQRDAPTSPRGGRPPNASHSHHAQPRPRSRPRSAHR